MARRKATERSGEGSITPPPQVDPRVTWGYDVKSENWFLLPMPTRDELLEHAERFGPEQVAETAAEIGFGLEDLTQLIERLDVVALNRYKQAHKGLSGSFPRARATAEKRAKKLLNWEEPTEEEQVA